MLKKISTLAFVLILLLAFAMPIYAMPNDQRDAIQQFVNDAQRLSRSPGMSVAVVVDGEVHFFSSGIASRETGIEAGENTLFELASVSKAFTALGLLYLEEMGLLSLSDSIADHLPWLTFTYNGQPVNMQDVRLYHFMHHTVGITQRHPNRIQNREEPDTLQNTVEALVGAELEFLPGTRMSYGTKNYNVLGLVMEVVAGQSYESFMEERIFAPLGLTQTFANRDNAIATGRLATGYTTTFNLFTIQRDSFEARGSVPTGYIISSTSDMARWMGIQMGLVNDVPEIFNTIIPRSHQMGMAVAREDGSFYAAGWFVNEDASFINHAGGNPGGFATNVFLYPNEVIGITMLSNGIGTNGNMLHNIKDILDGNLQQSYTLSLTQLLDIMTTIITVVGVLLAGIFIILGLKRRKQGLKHPLSRKRVALISLWAIITLAVSIMSFMFPRFIFVHGWILTLRQTPLYSFLTAFIALAISTASITWFVLSSTTKKSDTK
ncbi:MAG: beta-lactamase family protein [Defluviitaleaceae bacterium]|nr:beta-lactamase family protein [Defluviitaleaceae bacterium]